jgi:undecaprenyl-diphosphatase
MSNRMRFYLNRFHALDSALCVSVSHTSQYLVIRAWFRIISRLGDGVFWYALMLGILAVEQGEGIKPVLHMLAAGLAGTLIYKWLKHKTHRPRPYQVHQDVFVTGKPLDRFSFPSGHTLHAVAFGLVALFYFPLLAFLLVPFIAMVAMSRVILGLHYPSDVLAGAAIGYAIAAISINLISYIN